MDLPRYIVLSDTILDREKIISIYMVKGNPQTLKVELMDAEDHDVTGGDAVTLWRMFDPDWRKE